MPAALAALAALAFAAGCSSGDDEAKSSSPSASSAPSASQTSVGAREAVVAYVDALNSRSVAGLLEVGGVKDEKWSRQEAEQILADRGGRGWEIKNVQVEHDMGPDTGSARLIAEDTAGKTLRDTFTVTREEGTWHLVVFTQQPAEPGKDPASTDKPTS
ncbi:hypothetical protein AB0937_19645 [Streptomyces sp. NPDC047880]|uniref:hypothetical protein n=1 Tax=Streptomyces sp. NPDC047880 TaxID=3155626 RepID=UPI00345335DC